MPFFGIESLLHILIGFWYPIRNCPIRVMKTFGIKDKIFPHLGDASELESDFLEQCSRDPSEFAVFGEMGGVFVKSILVGVVDK